MSSNSNMPPEDLELCRSALKTLTCKKNSGINYLFLEAVDTNQFPTYAQIVKKPMDLGLLGRNLENGVYSSRDEFFADALLIFENAQTFHGNNPGMEWLLKMARDMIKLVVKEKKKAEKASAKKNKSSSKGPGEKKLKLKLGGPSSSSAAIKEEATTTTSESAKPKSSLSLKLSSASAPAAASGPPPAIKTEDTTTTSDKPKKPRLKLSLKKGGPAAPAPASAPAAAAPAPPSALPKVQVKMPRGGKELPRGVNKTAPAKKSSTTKLQIKAMKPPTIQQPPRSLDVKPKAKPPGTLPPMTAQRKIQCTKVLAGLKARESKDVVWFLQPVSDKLIVDDYRAKIKYPVDLGTMSSKLEKNEYRTLSEFVLDLRRIFANCLRYNASVHDSFRPLAVKLLSTVEHLLAQFVGKPEAPNTVYPPLLYCWKLCVKILDALLNVTNPTDGLQTCHYFLHPVSFFCGGNFPPDYLVKVKRPMDFGTVTSLLIEGHYQDVAAFAADCRLVIQNCVTYYSDRPDGSLILEQANRLNALITQQLDALIRYDQSPSGAQARANAVSWITVRLEKPPESWLRGILAELREAKYTDKYTKITEPAMAPFEKPVDILQYRDYPQFVSQPMALETVDQKIKSGLYETPEDFQYDVDLIFRNCEAYNAPRRSDHLVNMGKYGAKTFRKIYLSWIQKVPQQKRPAPPSSAPQPESKKARTEASGPAPPRPVPRISISMARMPPSNGKQASAGKRAQSPGAKSGGSLKKRTSDVAAAKDVAPPLHVAIAQVKEQFPLRRQYKFLESWECACARFFKELMRHPWISAARPQFIFHVPVPILFPQLKEAYEALVAKPMDLTTVEAKLLQGGMYQSPQDFVDDVSLVFANAIAFNKAGRDEGDPLSCAYYDASIHLLRYTRWLSLELLVDYLKEDEHVDKGEDGLPPFHWKLTKENRKKAREEMESIVMDEPIEKSLPGDRYTWTEAECEKLLKALRHQSDLRYMTFFISPNYPADYAAFISKPMDWEHCQKKLQRREYDTFREIVDDLRLIFTNALRYNARAKGTQSVSGRAYDSAVFMSAKLETAVDKMIMTVSDRLERERIDHSNAEREIAAAERVEAERMREMLKKDPNAAAAAGISQPAIETIETIRIISTRPRRDMTNFEMPFFEEDEGNHEQSHIDAMRLQKATFERQRIVQANLHKTASTVGARVFAKLQQTKKAQEWVKKHEPPERSTAAASGAGSHDGAAAQDAEELTRKGSSVLDSLNQEGRSPIKFIPKALKPKKRKKVQPAIKL